MENSAIFRPYSLLGVEQCHMSALQQNEVFLTEVSRKTGLGSQYCHISLGGRPRVAAQAKWADSGTFAPDTKNSTNFFEFSLPQISLKTLNLFANPRHYTKSC